MNQQVEAESRGQAPGTTRRASAQGDDEVLLLLLAAVLVTGWWLRDQLPWKAANALGYQMGLVGGVCMLVLLLYPLAKRLRFMREWLALKHWFRWHMVLGIVGPVLVLFHARFQLGSFNGSTAMIAMLLVFGSGLLGRILYRRIHHGLYGRRESLEEIKFRLGMQSDDVKSRFRALPAVEQHLVQAEARVLDEHGGWRQVFLVDLWLWRVRRKALTELRQTLKRHGQKKGWSKRQLRERFAFGERVVNSYISALVRVARFRFYERVFSYWHVLHIPLIFLLAASAALHVIAVHMY